MAVRGGNPQPNEVPAMRLSVRVLLLMTAALASSCRTAPQSPPASASAQSPPGRSGADASPAECPAAIQGQVRLSASAVGRPMPTELAVDEAPARPVLARTIELAV